jgi:TATA-binding protein-associated factor
MRAADAPSSAPRPQHTAHRCLATLAAARPEAVLPPLLKRATPLLHGTKPLPCRLGAVEVMAALVQQLQRQLVPYTVLLVVPLLRRMSDPVAAVRQRAALCFGGLTALLPLAQGQPLPPGLDAEQAAAAEQDGAFLSQLLDNRQVEDYILPVQLKVCVEACAGGRAGLDGLWRGRGLHVAVSS